MNSNAPDAESLHSVAYVRDATLSVHRSMPKSVQPKIGVEKMIMLGGILFDI